MSAALRLQAVGFGQPASGAAASTAEPLSLASGVAVVAASVELPAPPPAPVSTISASAISPPPVPPSPADPPEISMEDPPVPGDPAGPMAALPPACETLASEPADDALGSPPWAQPA